MANAAQLTSMRTKIFVEQQNLVRGAFAQRRKRGFDESASTSSTLNYRTNIRRALMRARAALDPSEYGDFLDWYTRQHRAEFPSGSAGPVGFDYLNGIVEGATIPLSKELAWLVARFTQQRDYLANFRAQACHLDKLCVEGDYQAAIELLTEITSTHGESMWSIQLRIALEQKQSGLEAQKAYYDSVKRQYRRGILAYVAHHTSVLSEDRTSWQRFSETLIRASDKRAEKATGDYFKYRLLGIWSDSSSSIANVLRVEQSHSIIDQYETFVALCQHVVTRPYRSDLRNAVAAGAAALASIGDFRLANVAEAANQGAQTARIGNEITSEALSAGANKDHWPVSDPWAVIALSCGNAILPNWQPGTQSNLFNDHLTNLFRSGGNTAAVAGELEKLSHMFRGLPVAKGILDFIRAFYPAGSSPPFQFHVINLNSSVRPTTSAIVEAISGTYSKVVSDSCLRLARALRLFYEEDYNGSRDALGGDGLSDEGAFGRLKDLLGLWCVHRVGDQEEVISSLSRLGSRNPSEIALLPVERMIGELHLSSYKKLSDRLAPLNALNMLWKLTESDKVASTLRLMTGQFLRRADIGLPSTIIEQSARFNIDELVYFLREVCVSSVLDVSRLFKSSEAVQAERQAICGALNALDPQNSQYYSDEVLAIGRRLKVDEGLRIVDQSRVHVDTDALTRWAHRTLAEDFDRYNDLARAGIGASGSFDDALREIRDAIRRSKQGEFFTPQNEADHALVRLLRAIREEFLNSSSYGLDYFLSKRIRHVSFIGLVRGPLEFAHLISTRPTANSAYGSNLFWRERLTTLSSNDWEGVDGAIKAFSEKFDDALNRLKSQVLHVRSEERPEGIFDIPLSAGLLVIGRALLQDDLTFEEFLRVVYLIFWAALEPSLQEAHEIINNELKMGIAHDIDSLKAQIAVHAQHDPAFPEVSAALAQASSGVQTALSDASSWFTRPELREAARYFNLEEALDVAIESALKLHRAFTPNIIRRVEGEISLSAPDLVFITDAVLVAFSNIKEYAKLDNPDVSILLRLDSTSEVLAVEIENEVAPRARSVQQDARIAEIASVIESGVKNQRTNMEGGSGFIKLAAVVQQSSRGRIEFGYIGPSTFKLSVIYSILIGTSFMSDPL